LKPLIGFSVLEQVIFIGLCVALCHLQPVNVLLKRCWDKWSNVLGEDAETTLAASENVQPDSVSFAVVSHLIPNSRIS
jgi:hypothetical protein